MSEKQTTEWPEHLVQELRKAETSMGYAARRNETAQAAHDGKLLSRQSILGAMDHALSMHADALRILEARIKALNERVDRLAAQLNVTTHHVAIPSEQHADPD